MRALLVLFAMLLLLLPSSLSAAMASKELGANMDAMASMSCCCDHGNSTEQSSGPGFSRTCCCDVDLPQAPATQKEPVRFAADGNSKVDFLSGESCCVPPVATAVAGEDSIQPGAPRAPPRPLFLSFQSFLN